jgi:hypothetical protein
MALLNHHKPFQHIVRTKEASRTFPWKRVVPLCSAAEKNSSISTELGMKRQAEASILRREVIELLVLLLVVDPRVVFIVWVPDQTAWCCLPGTRAIKKGVRTKQYSNEETVLRNPIKGTLQCWFTIRIIQFTRHEGTKRNQHGPNKRKPWTQHSQLLTFKIETDQKLKTHENEMKSMKASNQKNFQNKISPSVILFNSRRRCHDVSNNSVGPCALWRVATTGRNWAIVRMASNGTLPLVLLLLSCDVTPGP